MLQSWMGKATLIEAFNKALREAAEKYNLPGALGGVRGIELETPEPHIITLAYQETILHVPLPDPREQPEAAINAIKEAYADWQRKQSNSATPTPTPTLAGFMASVQDVISTNPVDALRQRVARNKAALKSAPPVPPADDPFPPAADSE